MSYYFRARPNFLFKFTRIILTFQILNFSFWSIIHSNAKHIFNQDISMQYLGLVLYWLINSLKATL